MFSIGQKVTIPRGRKGERPDFYAGRIVSQPVLERVAGRLTQVAEVITAEQTLSGEWRLAKAIQDLNFAFPVRRPDVAAEAVALLDGTPAQPKTIQELISEHSLGLMAYLESRPASVSEMTLDEVDA